MSRKMYAAVVEQFGQPLTIQEWEIPTPGAGQILVKTEACGVCHTDLHAAHGDWPLKPKVKADVELQPLSSINNIFERLQHGHVESRVVIDFDMR